MTLSFLACSLFLRRIRPGYIFEKICATLGTFSLIYVVTEHFICTSRFVLFLPHRAVASFARIPFLLIL
jgi:hypothetical protein